MLSPSPDVLSPESQALLYGALPIPYVVAAELQQGAQAVLYVRPPTPEGLPGKLEERRVPFRPFFFLEDPQLLTGCPEPHRMIPLSGPGPLRMLVQTPDLAVQDEILKGLRFKTNTSLQDPTCPYFVLNDPIQQALTALGTSLFYRLPFTGLLRMQVDLETWYNDPHEFPNACRAEDRILLISLSDNTGWERVISARTLSEKEMIEAFVACVRERDPDVIEGHNLYRFDLPYLAARAARYGVPLSLGRDGSPLRSNPSRFILTGREQFYHKHIVMGRHVMDTMLLAQLFDAFHAPVEGYGLKELARAYGVAPAERTYVAGQDIRETWHRDPARLESYALDDVRETRAMASIFLQPLFVEAQSVSMTLLGAATRPYERKVEAMIVRAALHQRVALGKPGEESSPGAAQLNDLNLGLFRPVFTVDTRELLPRLMLSRGSFSQKDGLGFYAGTLTGLARAQAQVAQHAQAKTPLERAAPGWQVWSALRQLSCAVAEHLAHHTSRLQDVPLAHGLVGAARDLLRRLKRTLETGGCKLVVAYPEQLMFQGPRSGGGRAVVEAMVRDFNAPLPSLLHFQVTGHFESLLHVKNQQFATLAEGKVSLHGHLLRSRMIEPFLRQFTDALLLLILEQRWQDLPELVGLVFEKLEGPTLTLADVVRRDTLREPFEQYVKARKSGVRSPVPAWEAVRRAGLQLEEGDQLGWYVAGEKWPAEESELARLARLHDPAQPDFHRVYYRDRVKQTYTRYESIVMRAGGPAWNLLERQVQGWRASRRVSPG